LFIFYLDNYGRYSAPSKIRVIVVCPLKVEELDDIKSIPADTSFGGEQQEEQSTKSYQFHSEDAHLICIIQI
jgi:hypothetical protein